MARETKVGLLAGLAFIVVFAAILANRGRQDPLLSQQSLSNREPVVLGEQLVPKDPYKTRNGSEGLSAERYRPAPVRRNGRFGGGNVTQHAMSEQNAPPGTRRVPFRAPNESAEGAILLGEGHVRARETQTPPVSFRYEAQRFASKAIETVSGGSRREIEHRAGTHTAKATLEVATDPRTLPQRVPPAKKKLAVSGTKYVVLAGDTLYAIVGAHYGKRSGKLVRAIVEANRAMLPDPNKLRVGTVLILPGLKAKAKSSVLSARGSHRADSSTTVVATPSVEFEWYQVQKGDRYASIAREKLGDARRWRELFELNKTKFPDPDRIRDGVLIKIPKSRGGGRG